MNRIFNFGAGPSTIPLEVLKEAQQEFIDYKGEGVSIMEASHRSEMYDEVHNEAISLMRELYKIPKDYDVLLLQGGASLQFAMIPMNLYQGGKAQYVDSGSWSSKAIKEAKIQGINYEVVASSKNTMYDRIPKNIKFDDDADYAYITANNTIYGTEYHEFPKTKAPLIVDASSDIFSYPIDWSRVDMLFAGAQKNAGPSGLTIVIIKKELINRAGDRVPTMLKYKTHSEKNSLFNTPPTFGIYMLNLILHWIKDNGGIEEIAKRNLEKAELLYDAIDGSDGFYVGHAQDESRSLMNVSYNIKKADGSNNSELEAKFVREAEESGMIGLKGHRSIGGLRASIYNAMSLEGVETLVAFMAKFQRENN
jgi:phosphoserine aminotransferase